MNNWDPFGLGSQGFSPLQQSMLESDLARPDAFGPDPGCPGCYETTQSDVDPTGAVGNTRRARDAVEREAGRVGLSMRRATDEARGYYYPRLYGCRGVSCFGLHAGAFATELFAGVAPQSRDDVLLDATLTLTTGGLAKAGRGLKAASFADDLPDPRKITGPKADPGNLRVQKADDPKQLFKAPRRTQVRRVNEEGYLPEDYPGEGAFFAEEPSIAAKYGRHYGAGVHEITLPRQTFDELCQRGCIVTDPYEEASVIVRPEGLTSFNESIDIRYYAPGTRELYEKFGIP